MGGLTQPLPTPRPAELGCGWPPRGWGDRASLRVTEASIAALVPASLPRYRHHHHCPSTSTTASDLDPALARRRGCPSGPGRDRLSAENSPPTWPASGHRWPGLARRDPAAGAAPAAQLAPPPLQPSPALPAPQPAKPPARTSAPTCSHEKFTTGPCRPRQEATTQSIELQGQIFSQPHAVSQPNWRTPNVPLHSLLVPFNSSRTRPLDSSLAPTLPITRHSQTLQSNSSFAAFFLLVYRSRWPWSQSC